MNEYHDTPEVSSDDRMHILAVDCWWGPGVRTDAETMTRSVRHVAEEDQ